MLLRPYRSLGVAEARAVAEVMRSGVISGFYGSPGPDFLGGPKIKEFERAWRKRFRVPYAVSMNSATSGLMAALGAVGVRPGDEVIVSPLTMSATVAAVLMYGGTPVFADVEEETGCMSLAAVRDCLTPKTRVILATNLFGHPARMRALRAMADEAGIFLVEDSAQSPLAEEDGELTGTVGHIGVFSLNYHKHIHTGEGGMCVTSDQNFARRMQLIRNHGENAADILGFNWRLTELQAAIGLVQLKRLDWRVRQVREAAGRLSRRLADVPGLRVPQVRDGCKSSFYVWMARIGRQQLRVGRKKISQALTAEGVPHMAGYVKPLYLLPVLAKLRYKKGMCPIAERLTREEWLGLEMCRYDFTKTAVDKLVKALRKVFLHYAR